MGQALQLVKYLCRISAYDRILKVGNRHQTWKLKLWWLIEDTHPYIRAIDLITFLDDSRATKSMNMASNIERLGSREGFSLCRVWLREEEMRLHPSMEYVKYGFLYIDNI